MRYPWDRASRVWAFMSVVVAVGLRLVHIIVIIIIFK